ncbi:MAG: D-alanyl-D-alanine carboxypeptidase [Clostridiales bacterium]|nr:D-alanyl-D-alanine carboxypeptidase [Clostridiales bacterium]
MGKRVIALLMVLFISTFMASCGNNTTSSTYAKSKKPSVKSKCAIVVELKSGKVVYSKNADQKTRPASMEKMMIAIVALNHIKDLDKRVATNKKDYDYIKTLGPGNSTGFAVGEKATMRDYLYGFMLWSKADAAMTVARYTGGGSANKFIKMENSLAKKLGMKNTHFDNVIGFDSDGTYMTCSDYAILLRYAMKNKTFKKMFTGRSYTINPNNKRKKAKVIQHTELTIAGRGSLIKGGKRGYTEKAQKTLAAYGKFNGKEYISVTTEAKGSKADSYPNFTDTENLYEYIKNK